MGTVLITDVSSGIGRAAVAAFAAAGFDVIPTIRFPASATTNGMLAARLDAEDRAAPVRGQRVRPNGGPGFIRAWDTPPDAEYMTFMRDHFGAGHPPPA